MSNDTSLTLLTAVYAASTEPPASTAVTSAPPSMGARVTVAAYCYILPVICALGIIGNCMNVSEPC